MTTFKRTRVVLQLAFSHLHQWLPPPNTVGSNYDGFLTKLENVGVGRVALLRHGNTGPASNGVDFDRVLTELGRNQAREAGTSFGSEVRPYFPKLFVSPAPRTVETAELLLKETGEIVRMELPQVLYDGTMQPLGSQLFRKIGYAPLRDYLDNKDENDRTAAQEVLGRYTHDVIQVLSESLSSVSTESKHSTLWIVGHAIYLPAVALGLASILNCDPDSQNIILSTNTKEAEGYLIETSSSKVSLLVRPSSREKAEPSRGNR